MSMSYTAVRDVASGRVANPRTRGLSFAGTRGPQYRARDAAREGSASRGVVEHVGRLAWSLCVVRVAVMTSRGRADDVMYARGPRARSRGLEQVQIVTAACRAESSCIQSKPCQFSR